jgi:hypothetical protein
LIAASICSHQSLPPSSSTISSRLENDIRQSSDGAIIGEVFAVAAGIGDKEARFVLHVIAPSR